MVCEALSLTWTLKVAVVAAVGVPLITPADSDKPAGKVAGATDHVYGGVPPVAVNGCEYATATVPAGSGDAVVITSGGGAGLIVIDSGFDTVCEPLSLTCTLKVAVVAAVGIPLITPADSDKPAGKVAGATDHVYGGVPPVAVNVCEYATPTVPAGSGDAVVITSGGGAAGLIVIDSDFDTVCEALSLTWTLKVAVVAAVGVPPITPADSDKPAGRVPGVTDHVYGGVPPVAVNGCEYVTPTVPAGRGDAVVITSGGGAGLIGN